MKIILPLLAFAVIVYGCGKGGDKPDPVIPPPAKPTVTFDSATAYSPNLSGTPITGTHINFTVKVNVKNQIDSVVLIDETHPVYFDPTVIPISSHYQILDSKHPYPSDDTYHLKVYVNDNSSFSTPSFAGK